MGLFDQILGAIDNPRQQGSSNQLGTIMSTLQQLSSQQGVNTSTSQLALSVVGRYVRSALQQKRATTGNAQAEAIVNQYGGTTPNNQAIAALFSPGQQQQMVQETAQQTGLNLATVQSMLPMLVPIVLNLLRTGNTTSPSPGGNTVLNQFLDANNDGEVDINEALSVATQFLRR